MWVKLRDMQEAAGVALLILSFSILGVAVAVALVAVR
jgi:hypothetical protein